MAVAKRKKYSNYHHIHVKGGTIELHINNIVVAVRQYDSVSRRQVIIDRWKLLYPKTEIHQRVLVVKPDWDNWNRVLGELDDEIE